MLKKLLTKKLPKSGNEEKKLSDWSSWKVLREGTDASSPQVLNEPLHEPNELPLVILNIHSWTTEFSQKRLTTLFCLFNKREKILNASRQYC